MVPGTFAQPLRAKGIVFRDGSTRRTLARFRLWLALAYRRLRVDAVAINLQWSATT